MADVQVPMSAPVHKRNVNPNINLGIGPQLFDHANKLGITLRSAGRMRATPTSARDQRSTLSTSHGRNSGPGRLPLSAWDRPHTSVMNEPQYVQDFVVPLSVGADEENVRQSIVQHSLKGNKALPYMNRGTGGNLSARSARSNVSASTYLSKYMSSTPAERAAVKSRNKENWNNSDQALRFQHEQDRRDDGLRKKRISEIKPHRVDRMYYMSGTKLGMGGRYSVDQEELERLKEMSKARRDAAHYGRGLRHNKLGHVCFFCELHRLPDVEKRKILQNQEDFQEFVLTTGLVPRQPPPSQLDGRVSVQSKSEPRTITLDGANVVLESDKNDGEVATDDASKTADEKGKAPEAFTTPPQNTARSGESKADHTQGDVTQHREDATQSQDAVTIEVAQEPENPNQETAEDSNTEQANQNSDNNSAAQEPIRSENEINNDMDEKTEERAPEKEKVKSVNFQDSENKESANGD